MGRVIYDQEMMGVMDLLGKLSRARIKDCFKEEGVFYCIVEKGEIGKAIGKGGINIRRIGEAIKKRVRMVEYGETAAEFIRNFIYPIRLKEIKEEEGRLELWGADKKTKSLLIGRDGKHLKLMNKAVKRFFDVEVKIV